MIDATFVFEQEEEAHFTNLGLAIGIDFGLTLRTQAQHLALTAARERQMGGITLNLFNQVRYS